MGHAMACVILISRISSFWLAHANHTCHSDLAKCKFLYTGITNDPQGEKGTEDEGVVGGRDTHQCRVCQGHETRRERCRFFFLQTTGPSCRLLVVVCAICVVRMRRRFSVKFSSSDELFNLGLNKIDSGVNPTSFGMKI